MAYGVIKQAINYLLYFSSYSPKKFTKTEKKRKERENIINFFPCALEKNMFFFCRFNEDY